jgi:hypothetical protein
VSDTKVSDSEVKAPEKAPKPKKVEPKFVAYRTAAPTSVMFDVQIKNEMIYGQWGPKRDHVLFLVPEHLVEGFETHWHFASGNIVRDKPAKSEE